ncbi:MAG TPA: alpha/beta fold hydrolase [Candidatus Paceibacterota bacterium]|nr:alpha/beta fold hydrolase [Candidatus Paceibacterota bacterium]
MARERFDHAKVERVWQERWEKEGIYAAKEDTGKQKSYVLDMFPYPSGEGLHVGHPKGYIATDIYSRHERMKGKEVLHPMGWDAFGLPAENYAIKTKTHPRVAVEKNIANFKSQLAKIGFDYDWSREINTTDPAYYKWTQWIFLKLLEHGLAHQSEEPINWCPSCMTGLANEDLDGGVCERCSTPVVKKKLPQWVLKITDYADRLLKDLDTLDWPEHVKESQRNWIGRSEGAEIDFPLAGKYKFVLLHGFTGKPSDPLYGWLRKNLEARGHEVVIPELPATDAPNEEEQVAAALAATSFDERTILYGHSLGAVVAMKTAEKLRTRIGGLVLAGGFVDPKFKDHARNFENKFEWRFDAAKIRANCGFICALQDVNDVAVSEEQADRLGKALGITVKRVQAEEPHFDGREEPEILRALQPTVQVFTTRPDTIYGATYLVLAPEHELLARLPIENAAEVRAYIAAAAQKTEIERSAEGREKTGVELKGVKAINPATKEEIPIYVADYVLGGYGTGAIMAVPAHDERDHEFAQKFGLPIKQVIEPTYEQTTEPGRIREGEPFDHREAIIAIVKHWSDDTYLALKWKEVAWGTFITGGIEEGQTPETAAKAELREEIGYTDARFVKDFGVVHGKFYHVPKKTNRNAHAHVVYLELASDEREQVAADEAAKHDPLWLTAAELKKFLTPDTHQHALRWLLGEQGIYTGFGTLADSGPFTRMESTEAIEKIPEAVGGRMVVRYKIRDWVFSRQRYWGEPIPIIHCEKDGAVPVPYEDLPVKLPEVEHYEPSGTGESPLAAIPEWVNVKCPTCGGPAKRETNTMPQWAGSSWYYLRFMDPRDEEQLVAPKKEKYWAPVDVYVGGDHAVRHLIYARFWHKFLYDIGIASGSEPFKRLEFLGFILAEDGRKMSKRFGNVINPDDVVAQFGADAFRIYEMFMGPFENTVAWSTASIKGAERFVERVWKMAGLVEDEAVPALGTPLAETIKKVGEDIEAFKFNTAISQMMIFANAVEKESAIGKDQWMQFLQLLAPFAPHLTEELWGEAGGEFSIHTSTWPSYDPELLAKAEVEVVVQVAGKKRGSIMLSPGATEAQALAAAMQSEAVGKALGGEEPAKVVYVPGRILNLVPRKAGY